MEKKKNVLIVDRDKKCRTALAVIIKEMGMRAFEASEFEAGKKIITDVALDLIIIDMSLPKRGSVRLIKTLQKLRPDAEAVAFLDNIYSAALEWMRILGVFRVLQKPFKIDEIKDTLLRALSGSRILRMANENLMTTINISKRFRFLVAHPDKEIFEKTLNICLSEGHEIEWAYNAEEFLKRIEFGFYDAIIISAGLLNQIDIKDITLFMEDLPGPILCLLSDDKGELSPKLLPLFSHVCKLSPELSKSEMLKALNEAFPKYEKKRRSFYQTEDSQRRKPKTLSGFSKYLCIPFRRFEKSVVCIYLVLIFLAFLVGLGLALVLDFDKSRNTGPASLQEDLLQNIDADKYNELKKALENKMER